MAFRTPVRSLRTVASLTKTVGGGKDYATLQDAVDFFADKMTLKSATVYVAADAGTYSETLDLSKIFGSSITFIGDARTIIGAWYIDNNTIVSIDANAGSGTSQISNSGNNIVVTGSGGNPAFDTAGIVNGDTVAGMDNTGTYYERTVNSVSGNTITCTATAPTIGNEGSCLILLPNRIISSASAIISVSNIGGSATFSGFRFSGTGNSEMITATAGGLVFSQCFFRNTNEGAVLSSGYGLVYFSGKHNAILNCGGDNLAAKYGGHVICTYLFSGYSTKNFNANNGGNIVCSNSFSDGASDSGFYAGSSGYISCDSCTDLASTKGYNAVGGSMDAGSSVSKALSLSSTGFLADFSGKISAQGASADGASVAGFAASAGGALDAATATATNNEVGYLAQKNGYVDATGTDVNNSGNTANYSPATSDTAGTDGGTVTWS